jgi:GTPase SAR1 family protein
MIVGENGVGKTCLMRRLLGEDIDDVTSTDGIDIVIRKCKIRLSDGKWIVNEGIYQVQLYIFHIQFDSIVKYLESRTFHYCYCNFTN